MKKFLVTILIILFSNNSYADVDVNNCDNLENKSKKLSCLTKLKAKALKENSTEKAKIIQKNYQTFINLIKKMLKKLNRA